MKFRKNKKRIDPRYFMDEKTDIIKENDYKGFQTRSGPSDGPLAAENDSKQQARAIAADLLDSGVLEKHTGKVFDEDVVATAIYNLLAGQY